MFNPTTAILLALAAFVFIVIYSVRRSIRTSDANSPQSFGLESTMPEDLDAPGVLSAEIESVVENGPINRVIRLKIKLVDLRDADPPPVYLAIATLFIDRYCEESRWNTDRHAYSFRFYRSGELQHDVPESLKRQLEKALAVYAWHIALEWNSDYPIREEYHG